MSVKSVIKRIAFLDRDGIVNPNAPNQGYVRSAAQFQLMPEIVPFMQSMQAMGYEFILVTNQQGIGKGLMTVEDLTAIHNRMEHLLELQDLRFLDMYYCPHLAEAGCSCRKPAPGMLQHAISNHDLDANSAVFIGDSITDAQAGHAAGIRTFLLLSEDSQPRELYGATPVSALDQIVLKLSGEAPALS